MASITPVLLTLILLAPAPMVAQVAGETHRTTTQPSGVVRDAQGRTTLRITIWYPAVQGATAQPLVIGPPPPRGPLFRVGSVAPDAPFAADPPGLRRPVILLSHGFGGTARIMGWFGTALAEAGYIVISVDHPGNNGIDSMTVPGAILWWERAEDLTRALEAVSRDEMLGPHLDPDRVGAAGFSAGGFTALLLGGARADPERFLAFCRAHPYDGVCRPQVEFTVTEADHEHALRDPRVAAIYARAGDDYSLPSVKAVYAMAPALVQAVDPTSLDAMRRPLWILAGAADSVAPVATNARVAADRIPDVRLKLLPDVGHYAFLATCTGAGMKIVSVCARAGDQEEAHRVAIAQAKELFAVLRKP